MKFIFFTVLFFIHPFHDMVAQNFKPGTYHLRGIMEMAAGFEFKEDKTFRFYYTYGASDRYAEGTYDVDGKTLKLHSDKDVATDFKVRKQSKKKGDLLIQIIDPNPMLISHVRCAVFLNKERRDFESDNDGFIRTDLKSADEIYLQHQLFPDAMCQIKDSQNTNNYFEIELNPSLQKVSFKGIDFQIEEDFITCYPNYFMPFEHIRFFREE
jgi:hypothetical protein